MVQSAPQIPDLNLRRLDPEKDDKFSVLQYVLYVAF